MTATEHQDDENSALRMTELRQRGLWTSNIELVMRFTISSVFVAMGLLASTSAAGAQSDPSLRTPPPATGQNAPPPPVFASPPPVTVKDGFVYAVLGDISLVRPVTQLGLPEFEKVLRI